MQISTSFGKCDKYHVCHPPPQHHHHYIITILLITRRVGGSAGSRLGCKCSEGFVGDDCSLNQQVRPDLEEGDDADDDVDDDADDVAVDDADLDANFDDDYVNKKVLVTTMMMMQKHARKLWTVDTLKIQYTPLLMFSLLLLLKLLMLAK